MAVRYEISGPATDGEYVSEAMGAHFAECELASIRFFDAQGQQVTPSAGTVTFTGSPDGENFRSIADGSFPAANSYAADRTPPYAQGLMVGAKVALAGVVGAETFTALVWRV